MRSLPLAPLYNFFKVSSGSRTPAYLVESTARINIDEPPPELYAPQNTEWISDEASFFRDIAANMGEMTDPEILIAVHGFNSPRDQILRLYVDLFSSSEIFSEDEKPVVCIGYRWPSETIGFPLTSSSLIKSFLGTAPLLLKLFASVGLALLLVSLYLLLFQTHTNLYHFVILASATVGGLIIAFPIIFWILRLIVYFRDGYRAQTYGVHGLVELLARIHQSYVLHNGTKAPSVKLVFAAHSMGAQVVTGAVKILADSLDRPREAMNQAVGSATIKQEQNNSEKTIGKFRLERLVLIAPDIPAEILISRRSNILVFSLQLFNEAVLFSNEADIVLKQLSRTANFFSYPTLSSKFGYRLGNLGIVADKFGYIPAGDDFLEKLQIGSLTLRDVHRQLGDSNGEMAQGKFAETFSYFDCTSVVEEGIGLISPASFGRVYRIKLTSEIRIILSYLLRRRPDVHSGYFAETGLQKLLLRVALYGVCRTNQIYDGTGGLDSVCKNLQVKFYSARFRLKPVETEKRELMREESRVGGEH